ncbi:hypothetical protein DYB25_013275 [Aphanomyces astaci]|uniref:Uncharacterized protein n=1 Tax=Aphanomyces astaci TaxID=112090 RepID=A0A397DAJ0_APHAT|nr:hypothetical protein DYB25_013275 [Aphanomyces astaci]RHY61586.1 hypothetical protein DYB30_006755 [Aphanomyces astaci]RHY70794.1 hypothetical protein DYB34_004941 [Aphanomyces astaci]RHY77072.1 hypothetical protein DYB38_014295 [Aphanomyces astaci]RHY94557.1 hypothetical protein DYB31_002261 [Aphanomyces astaci]
MVFTAISRTNCPPCSTLSLSSAALERLDAAAHIASLNNATKSSNSTCLSVSSSSTPDSFADAIEATMLIHQGKEVILHLPAVNDPANVLTAQQSIGQGLPRSGDLTFLCRKGKVSSDLIQQRLIFV